MISEVTIYVTADGGQFRSREAAERYEKMRVARDRLNKLLPPLPRRDSYRGDQDNSYAYRESVKSHMEQVPQAYIDAILAWKAALETKL